jgi:hypothetical protein
VVAKLKQHLGEPDTYRKRQLGANGVNVALVVDVGKYPIKKWEDFGASEEVAMEIGFCGDDEHAHISDWLGLTGE